MSIQEIIFGQLEEIRAGSDRPKHPLAGDLPLLETGIDSLGLAILVARLEDRLGIDPFTEAEISVPPVTLGDFVRIYEHAAQSV